MGIPRYFGWLCRKYGDIVSNMVVSDVKRVEYLYFDFNCLVYQVLHMRDSYYRDMISNGKITMGINLRRVIIDDVIDYVNYVVREVVIPTRVMYISLDGVVPWAKMHQQRSRRYKGPILRKWENEIDMKYGMLKDEIFDVNQITPGTEFMCELGDGLKRGIEERRIKLLKGVVSYVSDSNISGEGEHKIMEHINSLKGEIGDEDKVMIYGLDADLVMLSMINRSKNMYLLREDTGNICKDGKDGGKNGKNGKGCGGGGGGRSDKGWLEGVNDIFLLVNVDKISEHLYEEVLGMGGGVSMRKDRFIMDYVFISFLFGNDFLHGVPSLDIANGGIDFVLKLYLQVFNWRGNGKGVGEYLVSMDSGRVVVNNVFLLRVFELLKNTERNNLKFLQSRRRLPRVPDFGDDYLEDKFRWDRIPYNMRFKDKWGVVDYTSLNCKERYYKVHYGFNYKAEPALLRDIVNNYIDGIIFVMRYYFDCNASWRWYNPYHISPFCSDIYDGLLRVKDINSIVLVDGEKFRPYEQLLMVLPKSSFSGILPKVFIEGINEDREKYGMREYYPDSYKFAMEDKMMLYSIEPLLPEIDYDEVKVFHDRMEVRLSDKERMRNMVNEVFCKKI